MRFYHQHEHPAHQYYHRASSAEQANHTTTRQPQYHGFDIQAKRNIYTRPDDTARKKPEQHQEHTLDPVLRSTIQTMVQKSMSEYEKGLNHRLDGIEAQLVEITSQLRLRLRTQQILYGDTQNTNDNTDNNLKQEIDYMDKGDNKDIEEPYPSLRCSLASSSNSSIY